MSQHSSEKLRKPPPTPYDVVEAFDKVILARDKDKLTLLKLLQEDEDIDTPTVPKVLSKKAQEKFNALPDSKEKTPFEGVTKEYLQQHEEVQRREKALGFDHHCTREAEEWEVEANAVIQELKKLDVIDVYDKEARIEGYAGQKHKRVPGDRFLLNAPIIEKTRLYRAIQKIPKGAHLHIHFNANLLPEVLLNIAKDQDYMYIMSDIPLISKEAFERCHLKFSILSQKNFDATWSGRPDLFSKGEDQNESGQPKHIMRYKYEFRDKFWKKYRDAYAGDTNDPLKGVDNNDLVDEYLTRKIVFQADEAYSPHQTAKG